jgi:hypothetical protein
VRFFGDPAEVAVRLVGEMGQDSRGYTDGVAFIDLERDFCEFTLAPPPNGTATTESALSAVGVKTTKSWTRPKSQRRSSLWPGTFTILRQVRHVNGTYSGAARKLGPSPSARTVPGGAVPEEKLPPAASAAVARAANRRRDVRTRVRFTACVRQEHSGEEIVECDSISKDGVSFGSRRSYLLESIVDVAVPFLPGAAALFVVARVKHREPLAGGTLFRYGAA